MIKYAAVPLLAILAACSAEVENDEAAETNVIETLSVDNLVITDSDTAVPSGATTGVSPRAGDNGTGQTASAEPRSQAVSKPSAEKAMPAPAPTAPPANAPAADAEAPTGDCTAEHRELGHC